MENYSKRAWAEIDLDAVDYNYKMIKSKLKPQTKILCVLKADAYGHGAPFLYKEYEKLGADWFGVSSIDEAIQLRKSGATLPILIFGYTPPEMVKELAHFNISQSLFSKNYAYKLIEVCKKENVKIKVHIKLDTGMSRIGFFCQTSEGIDNSVQEIAELSEASELDFEGIFTHFSVADNITDEKEYTLKQFDSFMKVIDLLKHKGVEFSLKHCCNSGGIVSFPQMHLDMVRAGLVLYGLYPSKEIKQKLDLRPVMRLKSVISQIKTVPQGTSIGYGRTFVTDKDKKIATVPLGYADGYSTSFSNKAQMMVCGKRASILGKVCMDQLMLDVSDIEEATENSEVIVFGSEKDEVTVDELSKIAKNINYEMICLIGKRVPRIYYRGSEVEGKLSYV